MLSAAAATPPAILALESEPSAPGNRNERVYAAVSSIPTGCVATYRQIATLAQIDGPTGARQVGYALRHLPDDHDVPWHRVIQASGKIAFEKGTPQFEEQKSRLLNDDVAVIAGRVFVGVPDGARRLSAASCSGRIRQGVGSGSVEPEENST